MIRILVLFNKRRKIVSVQGTDLQDLKAAVFAEFDGILSPQTQVIFQKWDEEFGEYVDFEEDGILKDKDKVQILQDLSVNCFTNTPITEHCKTLQSPTPSSGSSSASSLSRTLSVDTDMSELSDEEEVRPHKQLKLLEEQPKICIPDGFPTSFQMPEHFGSKVDKALKSGEVDNKIRSCVVRTVSTCVCAVVKKPTPLMSEYLAKKLVQRYPCLRERDPREFLKQAGVKVDDKGKPFKNWAMLKKQFQRRFENMQSGRAEKEEDLDSSMSDEGHQGSGSTTDVDDGLSTERNINKLKSELTKSKWNSKVVHELLKATFTARRKAMLKVDARNRIPRSLKEYRCLSHQVEFEEELLNCLEKVYNLKLTIESMILSWKRLVDPILNLARRKKVVNPKEDSEFGNEIKALQCLPALFRLQNVAHKDAVQSVIVSPEEVSSFEETNARASSPSPFLLYNPCQQMLLMQNSKEEFTELSFHGEDVIARAVISLIGIYYIFHLEYPAVAKGAYLFLQEHVLHDFLAKRPLRYAARLFELKIPAKSNV